MEQVKKVGRPKKVVQEPKVPETRDAIITINLKMPRHDAVQTEIRIKDVIGNYLGAQRTPEGFMEIIKRKLQ
jgi:hypothetical protein